MESIEIPASVTSIERYAFSYCSKLNSLVIPASVTSIDQYIVAGASALTSIEFEAPTGWKRVAESNEDDWRNRTGGVDAGFANSEADPPLPQNPSQIASWFKTTYASSYWYKN